MTECQNVVLKNHFNSIGGATGYAGYTHTWSMVCLVCPTWDPFIKFHCHITLFWCDFQVAKCTKFKIFQDRTSAPFWFH